VAYWTGIIDISPLGKFNVNEIISQLLNILKNNKLYTYPIDNMNSRLYVPFSSEQSLLEFRKLEIRINNIKLPILNAM